MRGRLARKRTKDGQSTPPLSTKQNPKKDLPMTKILLEIAYDGAAFSGYQVQPNRRTVQGELGRVVEQVLGQPCNVSGCGRTDKGVHARQFFCSVETENPITIPLDALPKVLNAFVPGDIAVKNAVQIDDDFHVRYSVKWKEYGYMIHNAPAPCPFYNGRAWHISRHLDLSLMQAAAEEIVGTHDFSAFCAAGSFVENKVRRVRYIRCESEGEMLHIRVAGDGFLYNMVRIITGTLVEVSDGKIAPGDIAGIIADGDRTRAGMTAPPDGLYLNFVRYEG